MRKIVIGVALCVILAVGGYFGAARWAQSRAEKEVDAAFATIRAAGLTAAHGNVGFDLFRRTLVVDDVVLESSKTSMNVRVPKVELVGLSAPDAPPQQASGTGDVAAARAALGQLKVDSIAVPNVDITVQTTAPGTAGRPPIAMDIAYAVSGIAVRDVRERRAASMSIERTGFKVTSSSAELGDFNGELTKWTTNDIDLDTVLAMFDPAEMGKSGPYRRMYGPVTAGVSRFEFANGGRLTIDAFAGDAFEVQPGKYNMSGFIGLMEAINAAGGKPSPAQMRQLTDRLAGFYEGLRMARMEARGISIEVPHGGPSSIEAVRFSSFENGRLGELTIDNVKLDVPQQQPVTLRRFTLAGLHLANIMRLTGRIAEQGRIGRELSASPISLLDGIVVDGLRVPIKEAKEPVVVDAFDFNWGNFVGPVPTRAAVKLKFSTPFISQDQELVGLLAGEGVTSFAASVDLAEGWTEPNKSFTLAPLSIDVTNWFSVHATASLGNVPRDVFTIDPDYAAKMAIVAMGITVGPAEVSLRDTGGLDRLVNMLAKQDGMTPAQARAQMLDRVKQSAEPLLADHPELAPVVDAAAKFIAESNGTLSVKLVPKGQVPMALLALAARADDPLAALSNFTIEATTTR